MTVFSIIFAILLFSVIIFVHELGHFSAAKLFGVEKAPRIVLIEQEGRAVSLDMDVDEVVMRVEQILSGDLYYFDQAEYK